MDLWKIKRYYSHILRNTYDLPAQHSMLIREEEIGSETDQSKTINGEFASNMDGPWAVYYDGNRYVFSKGNAVNRDHLQGGLETFKVATDDGVGGKWVWH